MSDCGLMRQNMPLLLTESLGDAEREQTHRHIEECAACSTEWTGYRDTWAMLDGLPEVEPPSGMKQRFLDEIAPPAEPNVIPFYRRPALRWLAQAAAVVVLAGGSYYVGQQRSEPAFVRDSGVTLTSAQPVKPLSVQPASFSIAESRVLPASSLSPNIEGRPDIDNIQFGDGQNGQINVSFDITSHMTVTGQPTDKSMVRLMRYVLENEDRMSPSSSRAIDWVRATYSQPRNADPEIASALANVLRNDTREGVRIKAAETLTTLSQATMASESRDALIQALKNDPNPAVRIKAVEALTKIAASGVQLDAVTLDTLRQKAVQDDENVYVRVKAAEALSKVHP